MINFLSNVEFVWVNLLTGKDTVDENQSVYRSPNVLGNFVALKEGVDGSCTYFIDHGIFAALLMCQGLLHFM